MLCMKDAWDPIGPLFGYQRIRNWREIVWMGPVKLSAITVFPQFLLDIKARLFKFQKRELMSFLLLIQLGICGMMSGASSGVPSNGLGYSAMQDTCVVDTFMCSGGLLYVGGDTIGNQGVFHFPEGVTELCTGVLQLNVTEVPFYPLYLDIDLCQGQNARFGNVTLGQSGYYELRLPSSISGACDTIVYLDLLVSRLGSPEFETVPDNGTGTGAIDLSITGEELSYQWSNGANTEDIDGLEAGLYTVTVANADGCDVVREVRVEQLEVFGVPQCIYAQRGWR